MKKLCFASIALLLGFSPVRAAEPIAGDWQGAIVLPGMELSVQIHLTLADGAWTGTIDIPAQGAEGLPLGDIVVDGDQVAFSIADIPGEPRFSGALAGEELSGDFTQNGQTFPFSLTRGEVEIPKRPQEPKPPFPYQSEEVTYNNGDVTLAGTLTLPPGDGRFPAVLLITGSGPQDRDEALLGHKPFLVISDHLTRHGFAVLRVDDRGVGGSTGNVNTSTSADFADDVLAGVVLLKQHPRIDGQRIGLLGHSEGGLVGPLAAAQSKDIAFVVSLAGPGLSGREVLTDQRIRIGEAQGMNAEQINAANAFAGNVLDMVEANPTETEMDSRLDALVKTEIARLTPAERETLGENPEETLKAQARMITTPWFRFFLTFDPLTPWKKVQVPVLALFGENDLQVSPAVNREPLQTALANNQDATVVVLPGLNHLFQTSATGNPADYFTIEETIAPVALETITQWLTTRFAAER